MPVTPNVVVGAALAIPTLPVGKTVTTTDGVTVVPVKISNLAFPAESVYVERKAVATRAPGVVASAVNHSIAPTTVLAAPVVSVSWNRMVG